MQVRKYFLRVREARRVRWMAQKIGRTFDIAYCASVLRFPSGIYLSFSHLGIGKSRGKYQIRLAEAAASKFAGQYDELRGRSAARYSSRFRSDIDESGGPRRQRWLVVHRQRLNEFAFKLPRGQSASSFRRIHLVNLSRRRLFLRHSPSPVRDF